MKPTATPTIHPAPRLEVDFLEKWEETCLLESAADLLGKVRSGVSDDDKVGIRDRVWPAFDQDGYKAKVALMIVPLQRVGAAEGKSGSRVVIGYFSDSESKLSPSKPMVIKLGHDSSRANKLKGEWESAKTVAPFTSYNTDCFASPLHLSNTSAGTALWSPYSSSEWADLSPDGRLRLAQDDFWGLLNGDNAGSDESTSKWAERTRRGQDILRTVYKLLRPLHSRNQRPTVEEVQPVDHYDWYLRGLITGGGWGDAWREEWADDLIICAGREWSNPFSVLRRLEKLSLKFTLGAVHGDLHPKNIVISHHQVANIIDFGWTRDKVHVAMDFGLLETNLRSVVMPPDVPSSDILELADWIEPVVYPATLRDPRSRLRADLISQIRNAAMASFATEEEWTEQYVIPLFLISFGLLKYLAEFGNQGAARLTVLATGSHIDRYLRSGAA